MADNQEQEEEDPEEGPEEDPEKDPEEDPEDEEMAEVANLQSGGDEYNKYFADYFELAPLLVRTAVMSHSLLQMIGG
ncbi:hypothetical protein PIB30_089491, partial [Stylosanthes scabra]|nr:hypothetical protein [Stylosanthes scabra]